MTDKELLLRKLERERKARQQAESLLEAKSLELFETNEQLLRLNESLEKRVEERTSELASLNDDLLAEIDERKQAESALQLTYESLESVVVATAGRTGEEFFRALTRNLAKILGFGHVAITEFSAEQPITEHILATWPQDAGETAFRKAKENLPPLDLENPVTRIFSQLSPSCTQVQVPLLNNEQRVIGRLIGARDIPISRPSFVESLLTIFGQRTAAEILRQRDQSEIRKLAKVDARTDNDDIIDITAGEVE